MPPWLLVDTQPDTLDTRVTRDTPVTCVTRDTRIPMGTGKENDAPGPQVPSMPKNETQCIQQNTMRR